MVEAKRGGIRDSLAGIYNSYLHPAMQKQAMIELSESHAMRADTRSADIVPQYSVQSILRPLFGRGPVQPPSIGDHPDFAHLKRTRNQEKCPIVTLFMDIESSTRLGILYLPEDVHRIKNSFIRIAIETAKSFDGHVHRIMGDSVMVFFGGKNAKTENAVTDALNCASMIHFFVDKIIIPRLDSEGYKDSFGIRIGIDYGRMEDVLWSSYGYPGIEEVTATSFYVDVASKLQHAAGRNQTMLGQSLMRHVDLPEVFLATKELTQNGEAVPEYYIQPNHTDRQGRPINYAQRLFLWEDYLRYTPLGQSPNSGLTRTFNNDAIQLQAELYTKIRGERIGAYGSCTRFLPKLHGIRFAACVSLDRYYPLEVTFTVENHGEKARAENQLTHSSTQRIVTPQEAREIVNWEYTAYRGLHFLNVEVKTSLGMKYRSSYGVYVD